MWIVRAVLSLPCIAFATCAAADRAWVTAAEYANFHVVVSEAAPEPDQGAALRFQRHWRESTGHAIEIGPGPRPGAVNVWIGRTDNPFAGRLGLEDLGPEGFVLRTFGTGDSDKDLVIAGRGPRGTVYGEWQFFESFLDARVFAIGVLKWPDAPERLPAIDFRYTPPFAYRDISYRSFMRTDWFANVHRLNGHWSRVPEAWGDHIRYARGNEGYGHTFHFFVDPDEYFDEHPEYFAEIDGKRVKYAQLCLTNSEVLDITVRKVREVLRGAAPNERIVSVSQMDYHWFDSWCTCANCRAIDEREKSHAGTIIHFVNQVAEAIADEFPDASIDTFAYMYSRHPPKRVRPRDNVIVRLSAIECDYSRPLDDRGSPRNRTFARDLKRWSRIADNLFVWDYTQNWFSFQGPHPNIHVLQANIRFFARHGVKGVYEQASPVSPRSDFEHLKAYILARSLWDPEVDWRGLYREFVDFYYGEAAPYIDEYLTLITRRVQRDDAVMTFNNRMEWMDTDLVEQSQAIFERAFAAVSDPATLKRLKFAYLPVQYAALVCPPRVYRGEDAYVLTRPPSQTFEEYWATLGEYRVNRLNDYPIEEFRNRLDGETPPRYETVSIEKLTNEAFELWVLPSRAGAVVRWRDRIGRRELLAGYRDITHVRGRLQEWATTDEDEFVDTEAVDEPYDVVERGEDHIVLQARLENGLELTRRIQLAANGRAFELTLTALNTGDEVLVPRLEVYPEFSTRDLGKPHLWVERDGVWTREAFRRDADHDVYEDTFPAAGIARWAYRFPRAHMTMVSSVDVDVAESLTYVYAPKSEFIGMGQVMDETPLEPGESRSLHLRFELTRLRPKKH